MRSILLQSRRRISSSALLLPRLSSSSPSSLPRRLNSTTPPSDPPTTTTPSLGASASSLPSTLQRPSSPTPSQLPSTRRPPPPLHVRSRPRSTTSPPAKATTSSTNVKLSSKAWWLSQHQTDGHEAKAIALGARLEAEASEVLVGTPEFVAEVRKLFHKVAHLARASDDHLRALSTIFHRFSTSPAALQEDGREWIRETTPRLIFLSTRRSNLKFESFLPSLRLFFQSGLDDLDLLLPRDEFRLIGVGLASGATNASEAVEIVEGLRRLSPSSFTEVEYEELLQAIGRVEDWTTVTQDTFQLPSFPSPVPPLPQPPRPASPPPIKQPTPPQRSLNSKTRTSTTTPPPKQNQSPSVTSPPTPSPTDLLQFAKSLSTAPPPSFDDLQSIFDLHRQVYRQESRSHSTQIETVLRFLAFANRAPLQNVKNQSRFAGIVSSLVELLDGFSFDVSSLGLDFKTDLLPLVKGMDTRGRVEAFAQTFYTSRKEDYGVEELDIFKQVLHSLPLDRSRGSRKLETSGDWERGFQARLLDLVESASTRPSERKANGEGLEELRIATLALKDPQLGRGKAFALLAGIPLDAPSSLDTLVVASDLYSRFTPSTRLPIRWRQHGDAIVRILLLASNRQGDSPPPFKLLEPVLRHLHGLPPSFIPSTSSIPSFALPLLPMASNLTESLLVVNSILRAQGVQAEDVPAVWSAFLSSIEQQPAVPSPSKILRSNYFKLVNRSSPSEVGSPLQDLVEMYLRRWTRAETTDSKEDGGKAAFETLDEFVKEQRREGVVYGASLYASLMETQVARKNWKGVLTLWEEIQEGAGADATSVEMHLLACLATSAEDRARTLITIVQTNPTMLPLLTPRNWSLYYSVLSQAKNLPSFVESVVWQAKEENASPLAVEDLAKGIKVAREVGGEEGEKAEERYREVAGGERFVEAERSLSEEGGEAGRETAREIS